MTISENLYYDNLTHNRRLPEWVESERYEYCEDFYEDYTTGLARSILARISSVLTALI